MLNNLKELSATNLSIYIASIIVMLVVYIALIHRIADV